MKLRYSPTSPFVRKVMVVAHETGLIDRIERQRTMAAPTQRNDELMRENPLVKVPALTTDDGLVLYDSPVICEYLDTLHDGAKLFPAPGKPRWIALRQQALADGALEAALLCRYENGRPEAFRWPDWIDAQMRKLRSALSALDMELESGELTTVAPGAAPTIGQIAVSCALGYIDLRYADEGWRVRHRNLARWNDTFADRPAMQATKPPAT